MKLKTIVLTTLAGGSLLASSVSAFAGLTINNQTKDIATIYVTCNGHPGKNIPQNGSTGNLYWALISYISKAETGKSFTCNFYDNDPDSPAAHEIASASAMINQKGLIITDNGLGAIYQPTIEKQGYTVTANNYSWGTSAKEITVTVSGQSA